MRPLPLSKQRRLAAGELLFMQGDQADSLFLVTEGSLRIFMRDGTRTVDLTQIQVGEIIGEMAILDPAPRAASAQATVPTAVIEISAQDLHQQLDQLPGWMNSLIRTLSQRLRDMNDRQKLEDQKSAIPCLWSMLAQMTADQPGIGIPMGALCREVHHLCGMPEQNLERLVKRLNGIAWVLDSQNHIHCPNAQLYLQDSLNTNAPISLQIQQALNPPST
jgi:CRP-like cAMP-binding protein